MIQIDSFRFGEIIIDGKAYHSDVYVFWDGEVKEFETSTRHLFSMDELSFVLKKKPEAVVIGTGDSGFFKISDEVRVTLRENRIELVEALTREAIKKFNELVEADKRVVAYMHITC